MQDSRDFLVSLGIIIALISSAAFIVSIFMLFFKKTRKLGLKILIISVIAFIIGFGTCAANFRLNIH